ncbi:hypothetical protein GCM10010289_57110 [Streptomyces violascens]|nr:hypothetical protein GCM10010289_57110 [Streptomyces violascens]
MRGAWCDGTCPYLITGAASAASPAGSPEAASTVRMDPAGVSPKKGQWDDLGVVGGGTRVFSCLAGRIRRAWGGRTVVRSGTPVSPWRDKCLGPAPRSRRRDEGARPPGV